MLQIILDKTPHPFLSTSSYTAMESIVGQKKSIFMM